MDMEKFKKIDYKKYSLILILICILIYWGIYLSMKFTVNIENTKTNLTEPTVINDSNSENTNTDIQNNDETSSEEESVNNDKDKPLLYVHFINAYNCYNVYINYINTDILINYGSMDNSEPIIKYLNEQNIDDIDFIIVTNHTKGQVSCLNDILNAFETDSVIDGLTEENTNEYNDLLNIVENKKTELILNSNFSLTISDEGIKLYILDVLTDNKNSLLCLLDYNNIEFLFADEINEHEKINTISSWSDIEFLKHDICKNSSLDIIDAVKPEYVFFNLEPENTISKPDETKAKIYSADKNGTIVVESDGNSSNIR